MQRENENVIRGKFRLGENGFPSLRDKQEKIMKDVGRIRNKIIKRSKLRGKDQSKPETCSIFITNSPN
jgi:hypothetical protein